MKRLWTIIWKSVLIVILIYLLAQYVDVRIQQVRCIKYNTTAVVTYNFRAFCYGFVKGSDYYFPPSVLEQYKPGMVPSLPEYGS